VGEDQERDVKAGQWGLVVKGFLQLVLTMLNKKSVEPTMCLPTTTIVPTVDSVQDTNTYSR